MAPENFRSLAVRIISRLRGYGIATFLRDGTVTRWLADAEGVTGYSAEEIVGRSIALVFTDADQAAGVPGEEIAIALSSGSCEDSRWHRCKSGDLFWANGAMLPLRADGEELVKIFRDETHIKLADEQRLLLLNELNHRVKNTLATVQSVAEQTLRGAGVHPGVRKDLGDRFIALSRAHDVLVEHNWAGADLEALVREAIGPHDQSSSPFIVTGPRTWLHPSQAVSISLALHELLTNALKYGSLSRAAGRVKVEWNVGTDGEGRRSLVLLWREMDGPRVSAPVRQGFGTRLLEKSFSGRTGSVRFDYRPEGFECVLGLQLIDQDLA